MFILSIGQAIFHAALPCFHMLQRNGAPKSNLNMNNHCNIWPFQTCFNMSCSELIQQPLICLLQCNRSDIVLQNKFYLFSKCFSTHTFGQCLIYATVDMGNGGIPRSQNNHLKMDPHCPDCFWAKRANSREHLSTLAEVSQPSSSFWITSLFLLLSFFKAQSHKHLQVWDLILWVTSASVQDAEQTQLSLAASKISETSWRSLR